jgi:hypothetical protein
MTKANWGWTMGLALGALLASGAAQAQTVVEPAPPPPQPVVVVNHGDAVTTSSSTGVIASSAVTFGLAYGASVRVAATSSHAGDNRLYVPLLGPWLDLGDRGSCDVSASACDHETTNKVLLVGDGVIQAASAIALVVGVLSPSRTTVVASKTATVHVVPVSLVGRSPGMGAYGSF